MVRFYGGVMRPGDLVFDIGSNNGERALAFVELGARVVCVEPQPQCLRVLDYYFQGNKAVQIVAAGCGAQPAKAQMTICEGCDVISTLSDKWQTTGRFRNAYGTSRKLEIDLLTLDMLIAQHGIPAFCKVDVEGFEREVLKGLHSRPKELSFEFTEEFFDDAEACMDLLEALGPAIYNYQIGETMAYALPSFSTRSVITEGLKRGWNGGSWGDIYVRFC